MKHVSWAIEAVEAEAKNRAYREIMSNPDFFRVAGLTVPQILYLRHFWMTSTGGNPDEVPTSIDKSR